MQAPTTFELDALFHELPRDVYHSPGQLSHYDRLVYYWAGKTAFTGQGVIVDAGALVGASAKLLAHGIRQNARTQFAERPILSFDQFEDSDGGFMVSALSNMGVELPAASSGKVDFEPAFRANTADYADLIELRRGDIARIGYQDKRSIEILSIDVANSPDLMIAVARDFFPHLVAGQSLVLNQDYIFPHQPWVVVAMELLAEYFEPLLEPPRETTIVHRLVQPIDKTLVRERLGERGSDFYTRQNASLIERARDRLSHINNQASLQGAFAFALSQFGALEEAREAAAKMVTRYGATAETFERKPAFAALFRQLKLDLP